MEYSQEGGRWRRTGRSDRRPGRGRQRELGLECWPEPAPERLSRLPRRGSSSRFPANLCSSSGWHNRWRCRLEGKRGPGFPPSSTVNPCLPPHHSGLKSLRIPLTLDSSDTLSINIGGIPHLAKNERDAPNFLFAALDMAACAPFFKERRMKFVEPTKLHRKSGVWGTRPSGGN